MKKHQIHNKHSLFQSCSESLLKNAPMGILLTDPRLRIQEANPKAVSLYGAPDEADLIGLPLLQSAPFDLERLDTIPQGASYPIDETSSFDKPLQCQATFVPLFEPDGASKGLLVFLLDQREQLVQEYAAQQRARVASLENIVSGMAHELNNPLTVIHGYSQLLLEKSLSDPLKKPLEYIQEEAQRCRRIINSLLEFSARFEVNCKQEQLSEILEEIVALCRYQLQVEGIGIHLELDPVIAPFFLDRDRIQRVFLSLISNSLYALKELETPKKEIRIQAQQDQDAVEIRFSDNGPGIAKEIQSRVFEPFYSTKAVGVGLGLGLSVAYGIIREHQGSIELNSEPGQGTHIIIRLPLSEKHSS